MSRLPDPIEALVRLGTVLPPRSAGCLGRLGHYDLLRFVGCGGMGIVFLARETQTGAQVALKLLRPELAPNPQARQLFLREVQLMRQVSHPAILPVLDSGESPEQIWFTMPFVEAGSVALRLEGGRSLAPELAIRIVRQVADALQCAQGKKGIIHRDLKPPNILLDDKGQVHLTDFGLARDLLGDSIFGENDQQNLGTAAYMSPLIAAGRAEDTRGDIYALGAVLYELLTGQPPYRGGTYEETRRQIVNGPPRSIREVDAGCPPGLAAVVESAMARALRDRYASLGDLVADLDRVAASRAPLGPHGQWREPRRWGALLRHRVRLALGAAVVFAGLVWFGARPSLARIEHFVLPISAESGVVPGGSGAHGPEFFFMHSNRCFMVSRDQRRPKEILPENLPTNTPLVLTMVGNVDGDGQNDLVISWWEPGTPISTNECGGIARAAAFDQAGKMLGMYSIPGKNVRHKGFGWSSTGIRADLPGDITGTRRPTLLPGVTRVDHDLLLPVHTSWGLDPRGLACFAATGTNLMRWPLFRIASTPGPALLLDLDRNGRPDVIALGSGAPDNGNVLSYRSTNNHVYETDDGHSYLYLISTDGKGYWTNEVASAFSSVMPLSVSLGSRSEPRLYASLSRGHEWQNTGYSNLAEIGKLMAFSIGADVTKVAEKELGVSLGYCIAGDLNGDGTDELLATDRLGRLHLMNWALEGLATNQVVDQTCLKGPNDRIDLRFAGIVSMRARTPNEKLIVLKSSYIKMLTVGVGNSKTNSNSMLVLDERLHIFDARLHRVAQRALIRPRGSGEFQIMTADWDGDGQQEIITVLDSRVQVFKLR